MKLLLLLIIITLCDGLSITRGDTVYHVADNEMGFNYYTVDGVSGKYYWEPRNAKKDPKDLKEFYHLTKPLRLLELEGLPKFQITTWAVYHKGLEKLEKIKHSQGYTFNKALYYDSCLILEFNVDSNMAVFFQKFNERMLFVEGIMNVMYPRMDEHGIYTLKKIHYNRMANGIRPVPKCPYGDLFLVFTTDWFEYDPKNAVMFYYYRNRRYKFYQYIVILPTVHPYQWIPAMMNINKEIHGSCIVDGQVEILKNEIGKDVPRFNKKEAEEMTKRRYQDVRKNLPEIQGIWHWRDVYNQRLRRYFEKRFKNFKG